MRFKPIAMLIPAVLFVAATLPVSAQSSYSAKSGGWPLVLGTGYSTVNMDLGADTNGNPPIVNGITVWADWNKLPWVPRGFGIEAEGEHVNWNQPSAFPKTRIDAGLGGPMYTWQALSRLRLYGKGLIGYGGIYFPAFGSYSHDTRTIYAAGFGGEFRTWNAFWVRADYEYQFWPNLFGPNALNPHGFTIGMVYDFSGIHRKY